MFSASSWSPPEMKILLPTIEYVPSGFRTARVVAAPIMTVKGNGATIANGDTSPRAGDLTNFGGTNVVQGTIARVFRLFNVGSAALTVTSITVEGDAGADFGVFPLASTTIGPGAALNFKVRFDPTATGFRFGVVRIVTNDALHSPWTFTIRGNGLAYPEIEVRTHTGVPIVSGSAADAALYTDFGPLAVDNRTLVRMYSVYNLGYRTLNLRGDAGGDLGPPRGGLHGQDGPAGEHRARRERGVPDPV